MDGLLENITEAFYFFTGIEQVVLVKQPLLQLDRLVFAYIFKIGYLVRENVYFALYSCNTAFPLTFHPFEFGFLELTLFN